MESLEIDVHRHGKVEAMTLQGPVVLGDPVTNLETKLDNLFAHDALRIVLDMSRVTRLDSSGIGLLVRVLQRAKLGGGSIKLVAPAKQVTLALQMCRVLPLFEVFDEQRDAIASFS